MSSEEDETNFGGNESSRSSIISEPLKELDSGIILSDTMGDDQNSNNSQPAIQSP
jgi:hypothetical protein